MAENSDNNLVQTLEKLKSYHRQLAEGLAASPFGLKDAVLVKRRLKQLVRKLNNLNSSQLCLTDFFLHEIVRQNLKEMQSLFPRHVYRLQFAPGLHSVQADEVLLGYAIHALLHNAVMFTAEKSFVTCSLHWNSGEGHALWIEDEGQGILAGEEKHILKPFERGSNATGKPGLGLGLFIAEKIVFAHQGRLTLENRSPQGTIVKIFLSTGETKSP